MKDCNVKTLGAGGKAVPASAEKENVSAFVREGDSTLPDVEVMAVSDTLMQRNLEAYKELAK
ncbi:MAG: hypothetical protein K6G18_10720 [Treponema sp.]|nr:hypothetical protein [Treponema sp.]